MPDKLAAKNYECVILICPNLILTLYGFKNSYISLSTYLTSTVKEMPFVIKIKYTYGF